MTAVGTPDGTRRPHPVQTVVVMGACILVIVVAGVTLVGQAFRGNRTVTAQLSTHAMHDASVDDAFYRCLDIQAHSLVTPAQTVALSTDNLADVVTMIKGFGSWVRVADPASQAHVELTLHNNVTGPGTCLGTQVIATSVGPDGRTTVRIGTGAEVSGTGPPPAPPL